MEQQDKKIKFYAIRPFGEKANVTFDFIRQNWKPLLKFSTYLILPLCLIQTVVLNRFVASTASMSGMLENMMYAGSFSEIFPPSFWLNYGLTFLFMLLGNMLMTSVVYSLMKLYNERPDGLVGVTFDDLKRYLFRDMSRFLISMIVVVALTVLYMFFMGLLAAFSPYTMVLTFSLMLFLALPLCILLPIYLFENIGIGAALSKTYRLGIGTWLGIFALGLLMGIISAILSFVVSLPWSVVSTVGTMLTVTDTGFAGTSSTGYRMVLYFLGILSTYGGYLISIIMMVAMAYQYSHATEKMESISVETDIDKFEQL